MRIRTFAVLGLRALRMLSRMTLTLTPALTVTLGGCVETSTRPPVAVVHGAGATFPAPLYLAWAARYREVSNVEVQYAPVGSGAGIEGIRKREVDFGASDIPLPADQLQAAGLQQFPVVVGALVPVINISGIKPGALLLSGALLARIYLGQIQRWNDPAIAQLNPDLALPDANITVVHRSEASGSSMLWSDYLSRCSPEWQARVGRSLTPVWPTGIGGSGNEGVASYVQRTRFAIGYVEYTYARQHQLSEVSLLNPDGTRVQASLAAFRAALQAGGGWTGTPQPSPATLPERTQTGAWPITAASYVLVAAAPPGDPRLNQVLRFYAWALREQATVAIGMNYLPLGPARVERMLQSQDLR